MLTINRPLPWAKIPINTVTVNIEMKYHFICDCVDKGYVDIEYVNTESQLANSFTKSLGCIKFEEIRGKLSVATMNKAWIKGEFERS